MTSTYFEHKSPDFLQDNLLGECYDILENKTREIKCETKEDGYVGNVYLIDCYPRLCPCKPEKRTLEYAIVRSARISFDGGLKSKIQDDKLVSYLYKHQHTSPFETVKFTFRVKCPIFVARHILRHRTANVNELSGRYSELKTEFYSPLWKSQSFTNKQGSAESLNDDISNMLDKEYDEICNRIRLFYDKAIEHGVSKELARCVLPLSLMTEFYFTIDLHNLLKFFKLRLAPNTQSQTTAIAQGMFTLIQDLIPLVADLFKE